MRFRPQIAQITPIVGLARATGLCMSIGTCFGLSGVFDDAELVGVVAWESEGPFCGGV